MGENTHKNCTRQNKNKEDPGRQQPCWGLLFCTNLTQPTGALDSASAKQLLSMLAELNEQDRSTILMVTHDPFSASFGNRVLFIKDGNLKKEIDKGQHNRNDFYQTILSEISAFGGE